MLGIRVTVNQLPPATWTGLQGEYADQGIIMTQLNKQLAT